MNWLDGIRRFVPRLQWGVWDGTPVRMEIDAFGVSNTTKTYYPEDYNKYVELQEKHYVLNTVIGKIAKLTSSGIFNDEGGETRLLKKIQQPNSFQSTEEFVKEHVIYLLASGYTMIWKDWKSYGNFDTLELINLNPDKTDIRKTTVETEWQGQHITINQADIIFFYDTKRNIEDKRGYSRIRPLRSQVKNTEDAQKAKNIQIANSGITIVSPKASQSGAGSEMDLGLDKPISTASPQTQVTQKDIIEDRLNVRGVENRFIVASKGIDAVNLSESLGKLDFDAKTEGDVLAIYDAFSFPPELSPYGKSNTYNNKEVAESTLMEKEVYPLAQNFIKSINSDFERYGELGVSYDHIQSVAKTKDQVYDTKKKIVDIYTTLFDKGVIDQSQMVEIMQSNDILP